MRTWALCEQLGQDLRYGLRMLRRSPGFTAVAVLSLALGIGANTAIFSFMDAILIRALPVRNPESLVAINWRSKGQWPAPGFFTSGNVDPKTLAGTRGNFPYPAFDLLSQNNSAFASLFAFFPVYRINLMVREQAEVGDGVYVSGKYFSGLGVPPAAGRLIDASDDRAGAPAVAVISYRYWQRRFGQDSNAIGQSILINNVPFTVVGVTAPEFFGVDPREAPDFYIPMHSIALIRPGFFGSDRFTDRKFYWVEMMGRLRPGVGMEQAQAALAGIFHQFVSSIAASDRERQDLPVLVLSEGAAGLDSLRRQYSKPLWVLLTMVALILAIACANTANLLLARAMARRREIAVRLGVGAGRLRIVRQLLTESVLLSALAGGVGILFARWGMRALTFLMANGRENFTLHAQLNWHVLGVTIALSVLTGLLFGLAPAIQAARVDVAPALKETQSGPPPRRFRRVRFSLSQALVVTQIAISLLILIAAGLFVRTLTNLQSVALGFNPDRVLLFTVNAGQAGLKNDQLARFYNDLQSRFRAIPGVREASLSNIPLLSNGMMMAFIAVPGAPTQEKKRSSSILGVGPSFFTTMRIPILLGREIDERDVAGARSVAVVNEEFAKKYFGNGSPVGRSFQLGNPRPGGPLPVVEIVGVARNARYDTLKQDIQPTAYIAYNAPALPLGQLPMSYAVRSAGDPLALVNTVRQIVHQANARVPISDVKTQAAQIDQTINQERTFAMLSTCFAILALLIASVGLYGTMAYSVNRRTHEIGIRMALGASRPRIVWMILRDVTAMSMAGLAVGLPVAYATSKYLESFLFKMKPNDPLAWLLAVGVLLAAASIAGYVPARRASRIDPMEALRHE